MSTYDPRTPLENGTVLRTMDGKHSISCVSRLPAGMRCFMRPGWMAARWT